MDFLIVLFTVPMVVLLAFAPMGMIIYLCKKEKL
jgi:hypothetical protein